MRKARVRKWRFLNAVKILSWCCDIETHMQAIERINLQEILLRKFEDLGREARWGKKLESVEGLDGGVARIGFGDGETADLDLLAGADGAWSEDREFILRL